MYTDAGAYDKAEPLCRRALEIELKEHGTKHPDITSSLGTLARIHKLTGAFGEALSLYWDVVEILEKALGPEHLTTAIALDNLATLFTKEPFSHVAAVFAQRALAIFEKVLGPEHEDTRDSAFPSRPGVQKPAPTTKPSRSSTSASDPREGAAGGSKHRLHARRSRWPVLVYRSL